MAEDLHEEALDRLMDEEVGIGSIRVVGAVRTRRGFLEWVLSSAREKSEFGPILETITEAIEGFRDSDAFEGVEVFLDQSEQPGMADLVLTVQEKNRSSITVGTQSGGTIEDTTVGGSVVVRNLFGRLERLKGTMGGSPGIVANVHSKTGAAAIGSTNYSELEFTKPFLFGFSSSLGVRGFLTDENLSYLVRRRGTDLKLNLPLGSVSYEATWREVGQAPEVAGSKVRSECGHSFKSAIKFVTGLDLRDNAVSPNVGFSADAKLELAGLLGVGDARHVLHEYEAQAHWPLGQTGVILNSSVRIGLLHALRRSGGAPDAEAHVHIVDRFFVGGPGSLRGFRRRGVGDHDRQDPLGTDFYTTAYLGLSYPVGGDGLSRAFDTKAQVWGTVGDVCGLAEHWHKILRPRRWTESTRVAVGIGLSAALPVGRLEINWCHVLRSLPGDREKNGLQLGLTQSFG